MNWSYSSEICSHLFLSILLLICSIYVYKMESTLSMFEALPNHEVIKAY